MNKVKDSVMRQIVVDAPLELVWAALTKQEHLNRWYTKNAQIDFRIGGRGYMNHGWGATTEGVFTEIHPMKLFVLQSLDGDFTTITSLDKIENGILVTIEYKSSILGEMDLSTIENMLFGTGQFLENLQTVYETGIDHRANFWKAWIGITHTTNEFSRGTKVVQVKEGTAAAMAGIISEDIIMEIDGSAIRNHESLERAINELEPESTTTLTILRNREKLQISCKVEAYPVTY
ncbi:SRPBCC family protein [Lysinibacillus sp. SGAir0095]|uniref:SRPBCC family protein n=1 Tax=Lysinibacillus sp. SGAir0095 TaxID=2070463 RepID=UPI00143D2652|nr:SRPBCC family protein [Lysinibacillus sp. SGAir0095]